MPKYAAIQENGIVFNTIFSDTKEIAEEFTGLSCVEYTDEPAEPGGTWDGSNFFPVKPAPHFIWDDTSKKWVDPTESEE
jgi:hypothetical protein